MKEYLTNTHRVLQYMEAQVGIRVVTIIYITSKKHEQ